jgi:hypothetical protein
MGHVDLNRWPIFTDALCVGQRLQFRSPFPEEKAYEPFPIEVHIGTDKTPLGSLTEPVLADSK